MSGNKVTYFDKKSPRDIIFISFLLYYLVYLVTVDFARQTHWRGFQCTATELHMGLYQNILQSNFLTLVSPIYLRLIYSWKIGRNFSSTNGVNE